MTKDLRIEDHDPKLKHSNLYSAKPSPFRTSSYFERLRHAEGTARTILEHEHGAHASRT